MCTYDRVVGAEITNRTSQCGATLQRLDCADTTTCIHLSLELYKLIGTNRRLAFDFQHCDSLVNSQLAPRLSFILSCSRWACTSTKSANFVELIVIS